MMSGNIYYEVDCDCGELNYIYAGYFPDEDMSKLDVDGFVCWKCGKTQSMDETEPQNVVDGKQTISGLIVEEDTTVEEVNGTVCKMDLDVWFAHRRKLENLLTSLQQRATGTGDCFTLCVKNLIDEYDKTKPSEEPLEVEEYEEEDSENKEN